MMQTIYRDKNIIYELARRDIKQQYRGSILGFLWTVLNPLLTMLVMWFIFSHFFGQGDPYYPIYLLTGNIIFSALRVSTTRSMLSLENNRGILLRTKIAPYVFPCSHTVASLLNFIFSLIALIPFMIWLSIAQGVNLFSYRLIFVFLMIPALWLFEYGIGLFLSVLYIFFKDLSHLYNVFLVLWNYITPIFWKPGIIGDNVALNVVVRGNPMFHFVTYFRECIYMGATGCDPLTAVIAHDAVQYIPEWNKLGYIYLFGIASALIGIGVYSLLRKKVLMRI